MGSERVAPIRFRARKQTDPRDTFDFTTPNLTVEARPTDPFQAQAKEPDTSEYYKQFGDALKNVHTTFGDIKKTKEKDDEESGVIEAGKDYLEGNDRPIDDLSASYVESYRKTKGIISAKEYEGDVAKVLADNPNATNEELKDLLKEPFDKYVNSTADRGFLLGFIPKAVDAETNALEFRTKQQIKDHQEDVLNSYTAVVNDEVETNLKKILNVGDLRQFLTDPKAYTRFFNDKEAVEGFKKAISLQLREALSNQLTLGKNLKIHTKDASKIYLNTVSNIAETYGVPELLEYAFEKDKDGVRVVDNIELGDKVIRSYEHSKHVRENLLSGIKKQTLDEEKELRETYLRDTQIGLANIILGKSTNKTIEAQTVINDFLRDAPNYKIDADEIRVYLNEFKNIARSDGFATTSDGEIYVKLQNSLADQKLNLGEINSARSFLTKEDWASFITAYHTQNETNKNKSLDAEVQEAKHYASSVIDSYKATDPTTKLLYDTGASTKVRGILAEKTHNYILKNQKYPSIKKLQEWDEEISKLHHKFPTAYEKPYANKLPDEEAKNVNKVDTDELKKKYNVKVRVK